jgi:hypothetical protein
VQARTQRRGLTIATGSFAAESFSISRAKRYTTKRVGSKTPPAATSHICLRAAHGGRRATKPGEGRIIRSGEAGPESIEVEGGLASTWFRATPLSSRGARDLCVAQQPSPDLVANERGIYRDLSA